MRLGVTEDARKSLQSLFHVNKAIRTQGCADKWRRSYLPEAERLVAEEAGEPEAALRDGIRECLAAMRSRVLEELAALPPQGRAP